MSILFDGTDDSLTCGTGDFMPENLPLSFYFRFNTTLNANFQRLIHTASVGGGGDGMDIEIGPNGEIGLEIAGTAYLDLFSANSTIASGVEYSVIVTTDGTLAVANSHVYVNGNEVTYRGGDVNGSGPFDTAGQNKAIGAKSGGGGNINGTIREGAVFNGVIPASAIALLSNNKTRNNPLRIATCARYWRMDDELSGSADGHLVRDYSGNAGHATGSDGANNTGLTWTVENQLYYITMRKTLSGIGSGIGKRQLQMGSI